MGVTTSLKLARQRTRVGVEELSEAVPAGAAELGEAPRDVQVLPPPRYSLSFQVQSPEAGLSRSVTLGSCHAGHQRRRGVRLCDSSPFGEENGHREHRVCVEVVRRLLMPLRTQLVGLLHAKIATQIAVTKYAHGTWVALLGNLAADLRRTPAPPPCV